MNLDYIAAALRPLAVPIADLLPDPANAKLHGPVNIDGIAASLRVYGQQKPVVVRASTMTVVAGNGTLAAAKALGWTHLAANVVEMDAATAAGYAVVDNRSGEVDVSWDQMALDKLLRECSTGNDEALDKMLADLMTAEIGTIIEMPQVPESIQENIDEIGVIKSQRKSSSEGVAKDRDTEKYLIVVYPSREAKEAVCKAIGLPIDERYVPAASIQLRLVGRPAIDAPKVAESKNSGACG